MSLQTDGMPIETSVPLEAVRIIVAAAADPAVKLDVEGLAHATGLEKRQVRRILRDPRTETLLVRAARHHVAMSLTRGISRLNEILDGGNKRLQIDAFRALTTCYRTLAVAEPKHDAGDEEETAKQMLEKLTAMGALKQPKNLTVETVP